MKQLIGILAVVVTTLLGGCAVYTPDGAVVVDPGPGGPGHGGTFCPPGQAKKGNC